MLLTVLVRRRQQPLCSYHNMAIPSCTGAVERTYQIPPFHEIVDKAMFVYDHRSPIQAATSQILPTAPQLLFPFMNFTCSGSITRLMFVASGLSDLSDDVISQTPVFSLWHRDGDNFWKRRSMGMFHSNQLTFNQAVAVTDVGLVEITFYTPSIRFQAGDILGLKQPQIIHKNNFSSNLLSPVNIRLLRQRGGYGLTFMCTPSGLECLVWGREVQLPYIAIEIMTSKIILD